MNIEKENLKILHFISGFVQGGAENLLLNFLKADNKDISFAVMNDQIDERLKQELIKICENVYFLNKKLKSKHPKYLFKLLKIVRKNNIDIINTHEFGSMMWAIFCKILKPGVKIVHTIHSSVIVKKWNKITRFFNKHFVDMNIAISDEILNDCIKNKLKVTKIYNGIDIRKFKPSLSDNCNLFTIIHVGRITHRVKGQDILIKALKECKNKGMKFTCHLVGGVINSDKESLGYLKEQIENVGLSEEIIFLGNREDIPELLAQSSLFILPSRYEGLPLSLLEAMAAKLPVIASNISGSSELVEHGKTGLLFESENHLDLAEKISSLYHQPEEMERLAQNGYQYVQGFDISMMCEKYRELYNRLGIQKNT